MAADSGDIRPVPDPTELTTKQLTEAIAALKELLGAKLEAERRLTDETFRVHGERILAIRHVIDKSETWTTKQLDQLTQLVDAKTSAMESKIADNKERITKIESESHGEATATAANISMVLAAISIIGLLILAYNQVASQP